MRLLRLLRSGGSPRRRSQTDGIARLMHSLGAGLNRLTLRLLRAGRLKRRPLGLLLDRLLRLLRTGRLLRLLPHRLLRGGLRLTGCRRSLRSGRSLRLS